MGSSATDRVGLRKHQEFRRAVDGERCQLLLELLVLLFEEKLVELGIRFHACLCCHVALFLDLCCCARKGGFGASGEKSGVPAGAG